MQQQPQAMPTHMNITSIHFPASSPQHQIVNNQANQVTTQAMHQPSTSRAQSNQLTESANWSESVPEQMDNMISQGLTEDRILNGKKIKLLAKLRLAKFIYISIHFNWCL